MLFFMKKLSKRKRRIVIFMGAFVSIFAGLGHAKDDFQIFPAQFNVTALNGKNGFVINGVKIGDSCGWAVSGARDINGDGIDDFLIGAYGANNEAGQSYVVFGSKDSWPAEFNLVNLNGDNGFVINGISAKDGSGSALSGAGDVNGDGIYDILISAHARNNLVGQSYVLFGSKRKWPQAINLADLNGNNGFTINGIIGSFNNGESVSGAGDVNGDGLDDILIGAQYNINHHGRGYVIFGNQSAWSSIFDLENLNGNNGFVISGNSPDSRLGSFVSGAGDVNGDGIADILISDSHFEEPGQGLTYVVFGSKTTWPANISLSDLNGANGFVMVGIHQFDESGSALSGAGDINGDGIVDILISAPGSDNYTGQSYLVFGHKGSWPASINLINLNGTNGVAFTGIHTNDFSGSSVSGVGDVNGDRIADILIGAMSANNHAGQSYIVFGSKEPWHAEMMLVDLNGNNGFAINGMAVDQSGVSVSGVGDINGDGLPDFIIGAVGVNTQPGRAYLIFGQPKSVTKL